VILLSYLNSTHSFRLIFSPIDIVFQKLFNYFYQDLFIKIDKGGDGIMPKSKSKPKKAAKKPRKLTKKAAKTAKRAKKAAKK
jgi:hypothetical protein